METIVIIDTYYCIFSKSKYLTYKEWKLDNESVQKPSHSVSTLPIRNGNIS